MHHFLVCDSNYAVYKEVREYVESSFSDVQVLYSSSEANWQEQVQKQMDELADADSNQLSTDPAFIETDRIEIFVSVSNGSLARIKDYASGYLGHEFAQLRSNELFWKSVVDPKDSDRLGRFLTNLKIDLKRTERFRFLHKNSQFCVIEISGEYIQFDEDDEQLMLKMTDVTEQAKKEAGGQIDLILIDAQHVAKRPAHQIAELCTQGFEFNGKLIPQVIVTGHEDSDQEAPSRFVLPDVCDYLYKPIDRPLFLEKVFSHVKSLKRKTSESFLYTAETDFPVEVAQEQEITALSTYGLKLKSGFPIRYGATVKIYSSLFGQTDGLWAQCFHNAKLSETSKIYENSLGWYGILENQMKPIEDWYHKNAPTDTIRTEDEILEEIKKNRQKRKGPVIHGATDQPKAKKPIVVVDLDEETIQAVGDFFRTLGDDYEVHHWDSIHQACTDLFKDGDKNFPDQDGDDEYAPQSGEARLSTRAAFLPNQPASFTIDPTTLEFTAFVDFPNAGSMLFGDQCQAWRDNPLLWKEKVAPNDKHRLADFLHFVKSGQQARATFSFLNNEDEYHLIDIEAKFRESGIEIEMTDLTLKPEAHQRKSARNLSGIELFIVDYSFVSNKTAAWMKKIRSLIDANKLNPKKFSTPVVISATESAINRTDSFAGFSGDGMLAKPLDRIRFLQLLELAHNDRQPATARSLHRWAPVQHYVDISRPATALAMGEKGITILNAKPVMQGALARFYHSSLVDDSGRGILARCYGSESIHSGPRAGMFRCYFSFFGVKDSQLKNIRKLWMQQDALGTVEENDGESGEETEKKKSG